MSASVGETYSRLTVLQETYMKNGRKTVRCECSCGNTVDVREDHLKSGVTNSCGCYRLDRLREVIVTHGKTTTKAYGTWEGMLQRCHNPNASNYSEYGGRGITICEDWLGAEGFANFYKDMGERPEGMSLDRMDVNGNYCKENCRWETPSVQGFNQRKSSNNTSGRTGVSWNRQKQMWDAYIMKDRKKINLGRFENKEEAIFAREQGELKYYGVIKETK